MRPRGLRTRSAMPAIPSQTVFSSAFSASVILRPARASRYANAASLIVVGMGGAFRWKAEVIAAFGGKRHGVKTAPVRIQVFEVHELAFVMDDMRSSVPGRDMEFDEEITRHTEGDDVFKPRPRLVAEITGGAQRQSTILCRRANRGIASRADAARSG